MEYISKDIISFVGLGKLGLPLACCFAEAGLKVICVDKNYSLLQTLENNELPFYENGLSELFAKAKSNLVQFTSSIQAAVRNSDVTVILVNSQLGPEGYSAEIVDSVVTNLSNALKNSTKRFHQFILSTTVPPGTIQSLVNKIEVITGRVVGQDFGFSYVPDFVKLGSVISDFQYPEFCLIGSGSQVEFEITRSIWTRVHKNQPKISSLTIEEAEIAKIALNAYIVNKISFANHLGLLCDGMTNVDVHNITRVIGQDRRISPHFFSSGTPFGGTCFPRDASAYIAFGNARGVPAGNLIFANWTNERVLKQLLGHTKSFSSVGILGITFKPGSEVLTESASINLVNQLLKSGKKVSGFDYLAVETSHLPRGFLLSSTAQECINENEVIVIMHPDKDFSDLNFDKKVVIDPWGVLSHPK